MNPKELRYIAFKVYSRRGSSEVWDWHTDIRKCEINWVTSYGRVYVYLYDRSGRIKLKTEHSVNQSDLFESENALRMSYALKGVLL